MQPGETAMPDPAGPESRPPIAPDQAHGSAGNRASSWSSAGSYSFSSSVRSMVTTRSSRSGGGGGRRGPIGAKGGSGCSSARATGPTGGSGGAPPGRTTGPVRGPCEVALPSAPDARLRVKKLAGMAAIRGRRLERTRDIRKTAAPSARANRTVNHPQSKFDSCPILRLTGTPISSGRAATSHVEPIKYGRASPLRTGSVREISKGFRFSRPTAVRYSLTCFPRHPQPFGL